MSNCPETELDIGVSHTFKAVFDLANLPGITEIEYEWRATNHFGSIGGESNIYGTIDGANVDFPITHVPAPQDDPLKDEINISWGDYSEFCDVRVTVTVSYKFDNDFQSVYKECDFNLKCLTQPSISGPSSFQDCCTSTITLCEAGNYFDYNWHWNILSGGMITSGQGTQCIEVLVDNNGIIMANVEIRSATGIDEYYRETSYSISRTQPQTPEIEGRNFACQGDELELCIDIPCGGTDEVEWSIPTDFDIVEGENEACITIAPTLSIPDGTSFNISAEAMIDGGCVATISNHTVTVYTAETPPYPDGEVEIVFEPGYDPCDDFDTFYEFVYHTDNPYINGTTTINPGVVIDVPHHDVKDRIFVTVCNYNYCSGESVCRTYTMFLPAPCHEDPHGGGLFDPLVVSNTSSDAEAIYYHKINMDKSLSLDKDITVYADALNKMLVLNGVIPQIKQYGFITIYDAIGRTVWQERLTPLSSDLYQLPKALQGVYFVKLQLDNHQIVKKIIL